MDVFVGDERVVPPGDEDANQRLIHEALLDRVGPVGSFTPMPTEFPVDECVAAYQRVMSDLVTGAGIDLIHLGMGPDGHTASLFPGAPTLDAGPGELVALTQDPNGVNPHPGLTLTLPAINSARLAVFTVAGASKADAVARLLRGDDIPAAASTRDARCGWWTAPPVPLPPRLASMLSDADLLHTPLPELAALARTVRDEAHGWLVTYSPKVFIPLTMLCRDVCGYCTFARRPRARPRPT